MADNFFSLVRTRDQDALDEWNTQPPVQDYDTGFKGASDHELRNLVQPLIDRATQGKSTSITTGWIAALDDKSEAQAAVVMHYCYPQEDWGDEPIVGRGKVSDGVIWWKWRVPFKAAWTVCNDIDSIGIDAIELYSRLEYQDADGVLQTEMPEKIIQGEIEDPNGQ
ncbi:hypothetical protein ISF_02133 [Cordyceps fumosorosea ARSEF 2679]|uniref:Uncharacterized protein n=1 Tax=Cordyceps fumosorosea (strain ARSEF 2679) TaxID=1081104 RepID=A0A162JNR2_CORFA|nr:hypothetical protein ISF_02133 [Cordyceps fumosorosea ARSEF 2679]OAA71582.1 hypothetical protein ISF_02133 [Cordyceps fumosorosea ARSEF 2679]